MSETNEKPNPPVASREPKSDLPFPETCRARSLWSINESAECLVPPPQHCEYVLSYGSHFYCHHPRREEIVIRTLKMNQG